MFTISQPVIETHDGKCRMTSTFSAPGLDKEIFFETEAAYGQYLTHEVADAFVVAAMLPALMAGEDIEVPCVSQELAYHFNTIMFLLGKAFDTPPIRLHAGESVETDFQPKAVGTAISGGVDSLCTFVNHTSDTCPEGMRISQLTLFNVGAYGNDYDKTSKWFEREALRARAFAEDVGLPLVLLQSNFSEIYTHEKISHYSLRQDLCISAAVLALQKLFRIYYISSALTIDIVDVNPHNQAHYEAMLTQRLSNAHTNILVAEHDLDRVQKTKMLACNPLARKHLYVCLAEILNEQEGYDRYTRNGVPHCTECYKCLRTIGTLDLLGVADDFASRFDIAKWKALREQYYVDIYLNRKSDHFDAEIWDLFLETGHELSPAQWEKIREREAEWMNKHPRPQPSARTCLRILGGKVLRKLGLKK